MADTEPTKKAKKPTPLTYRIAAAIPNGIVIAAVLGILGFIGAGMPASPLPAPAVTAGVFASIGFATPFGRAFLEDIAENK